MYEYIQGKLVIKTPTHVVIDVGGVGYHIIISLYTYEQLGVREQCKLFIDFQVREDAQTLYGFYDEGERRLFRHLMLVSGIGANTARMILSSITPQEIQEAIVQGDVNLIKRIKGIGPKTAQRMILELQDRLKKNGPDDLIGMPKINSAKDEALAALTMLGFSKAQAGKALDIVAKDHQDAGAEVLIKAALKRL